MAGAQPSPTTTGRLESGLTAAQLSVALLCIVFLAVIVPTLNAMLVAGTRMKRAQEDVDAIASAVRAFSVDVGVPPVYRRATNDGLTGLVPVDLLVGPGEPPKELTATPWSVGETDTVSNQLQTNAPGYAPWSAVTGRGWKGPYLPRDCPVDPWGNRYLVRVEGGDARDRESGQRGVLVLSAGPNGIVETPYKEAAIAGTAGGDDVVARVPWSDLRHPPDGAAGHPRDRIPREASAPK